MTTLHVQFSDLSKTAIISWFCGPQDSETYANLGTVESSSPIWKYYYDSLPLMISQGMPAPD